VTRVQKERFATAAQYDAVKDVYVVDQASMAKAKSTMVVQFSIALL
jgi:aspartate carbamoyltransferase catalytic subunit